ncbi:hypothetical protein PLICRDRAFT_329256 [Plicaturopsis crispa FD-325 SS-3]|uniref:DNA2/NAM7 helicase-like C-terminal domain-containing protein n=1 Tax=Plicaturopsis crispa FD-325 SS-3 TaxID=944288 RepID=A0A0C9T6S8_PLICR|nr:hypothetical protein PLICRDRAFT_329256 [Plicaturopsis crispa FD-325 SS-3]
MCLAEMHRIPWIANQTPYRRLLFFPTMADQDQPFDLTQDIFIQSHPSIRVCTHFESQLTDKILAEFTSTAVDGAIGVAPTYGAKCALTSIAFATSTQVLLVRLSKSEKQGKQQKKKRKGKPVRLGRALVEDAILCNPLYEKFALKAERLAASLHLDVGRRITACVDLLSASTAGRDSFSGVMAGLGGEPLLRRKQTFALFKLEENDKAPIGTAALQSWAAWRAGTLPSMAESIRDLPRINTQAMHQDAIEFLAKTMRDADRLDTLKPTRVKNDVSSTFSNKSGSLNLKSLRYKTRVMRLSERQTIEIETIVEEKRTILKGRNVKVEGRAVNVKFENAFTGSKIKSVTTYGRAAPTLAEQKRARAILEVMLGTPNLIEDPFVRKIWLPSQVVTWPAPRHAQPLSLRFNSRPLNSSQIEAVNAILSDKDKDRLTVIHGPPGTGKTTVIGAAVVSTMASCSTRTMWLVAQSNVAVKNIAEKLADVGFFKFKILVSKEFHFDWYIYQHLGTVYTKLKCPSRHEHLYGKIRGNIVRSDDFPDDIVAAERRLLDTRVILCTLSMLSNDEMECIPMVAPIQTVLVDEASQIEVGAYVPLFSRWGRTLQKIVFIGDDRQLAPFGQDDIPNLRSVFEIEHLRSGAIFLDTQYRMPMHIGSFISKHVYGKRLKSVHKINSRLACRLVDVDMGREESAGHSWVNPPENAVAIQIARHYIKTKKSWRYITPYDPQRSHMEKELKAAKLPFEDKCFNVDSFQGNEDDHIIISCVRHDKLGFLSNQRRTNVMLSRCKQSMIICTSRAFVNGPAKDSLVWDLARHLGPKAWLSVEDVASGRFQSR